LLSRYQPLKILRIYLECKSNIIDLTPLWEKRKFRPKDEKKAVMVALRKLGRRDVRKLLEGKVANQGD
jgi:hypothetical protein